LEDFILSIVNPRPSDISFSSSDGVNVSDSELTVKPEHFQEIPFFRIFAPEQIEQLRPYFQISSYADTTVLFEEGDRGDYTCFILEGTIEIRKESVSSKQTVIAKFGRGSIVGEMALIDEYPRSASAKVTAKSKLLILQNDSFNELLANYPNLGILFFKEIAKILSQRLRRTAGRFSDIF